VADLIEMLAHESLGRRAVARRERREDLLVLSLHPGGIRPSPAVRRCHLWIA
jgi:hypothetical protein